MSVYFTFKKRYKLERSYIFLILLELLIFSAYQKSARASDFEQNRETLRGVKELAVVVENTTGEWVELERLGLTTELIRSEIELQLRNARIKVFTPRKMSKDSVVLYIGLGAVPIRLTGQYAYSIRVELQQWTALHRNPKIEGPGITWSDEIIGSVGKDHIMDIRNSVADGLEGFIKAYHSVN